ncbi:hypothetical protein pb186bvf_005136 [Paramecium bursaria]
MIRVVILSVHKTRLEFKLIVYSSINESSLFFNENQQKSQRNPIIKTKIYMQ